MNSDILSHLGAPAPFDPNFKFVTSTVFNPLALGIIRFIFAIYTTTTLLIVLIHDVMTHSAKSYLSFFTKLSYIGLCAYFWASSVQTLAYASRKDKASYPLQRWPRALQLMHSLLWTTITNFPFVITPVYWSIIATPELLATTYDIWENTSVHALNSVFALFEIFFSRAGPQPWSHTLILILLLGGYVGVAYITHATQGIYTYDFLDPKKEGAKLAIYLVGIPAASIIIFGIVWNVCCLKCKFAGVSKTKDDGSEVEVKSELV